MHKLFCLVLKYVYRFHYSSLLFLFLAFHWSSFLLHFVHVFVADLSRPRQH